MWIYQDNIMIDLNEIRCIFCQKIDGRYKKEISLYYKNVSSSSAIVFKKITGNDFIKYLAGIMKTPDKAPFIIELDDDLEDIISGTFKTIEEFSNNK